MVDLSNLLKLRTQMWSSSKTSASAASNSTGASSSATPSDNDDNTDIATKHFSIKVNGEAHSMYIDEDGRVWDYNSTDDAWTERNNDEVLKFQTDDITYSNSNVDLDAVKAKSVTVTNPTASSTYNLNDQSAVGNYGKKTKTNDNNTSKYNVAVIDDFSSSSSEIAGTDVTHGDIVRALISGSTDTSTDTSDSLNFDLGDDFSYLNILSKLNAVDNEFKSGTDIDAVNLSLGSSEILDALDTAGISLADLKSDNAKETVINALAEDGQNDLVTVINKISNMSSEGINFYIAAGNDADDTYYSNDTSSVYAKNGDSTAIYNSSDSNYSQYKSADTNNDGAVTDTELYNYYISQGYVDEDNDGEITAADMYLQEKSYDKNNDGVITGGELGVFNALTLAIGNNVHVIGATSSSGDFSSSGAGGIADYSDQNGTVDAYYDGDVNVENLGVQANGKYGYDINGDGKADIYSYEDDDIGASSNYTYVDYDSSTGLYEFQDSSGNIVYSKSADGRNQLLDGTSFATPKAAKKHDANLT